MSTRALEKAIEIAGGQAALGRAVGASQKHVWNWLNRQKQVPGVRVLAIEKATKGVVTRQELRPDLYPPNESTV